MSQITLAELLARLQACAGAVAGAELDYAAKPTLENAQLVRMAYKRLAKLSAQLTKITMAAVKRANYVCCNEVHKFIYEVADGDSDILADMIDNN